MFFELLLLSVVVVTAYLGPMMWRRLPPGNRGYAWMLLIDLAVALVSFTARQDEGTGDTADLLGAIAIGGAVCLVLVPPILRDISRRALMADRLRLALWFTDLRELLQPGLGARQERELIEAIVAVRSGKVEEAIDTLKETRAQLEHPMARRQIDERIVMTYLYARDWEQAIRVFEQHLETPPGPMSPQLVVEMVRAYCEAGEMGRAADLVERLEQSPLAAEPILAFLINRSRLVFLAFVGRTTAVEAIVAPNGPLGAMPPAAREFWSGVARQNAGDRTGARSSFEQAARLSGRDKRARELAEKSLGALDTPGVIGPHPMPAPVAELADRLTAIATSEDRAVAPKPAPKLAGVGMRAVPVTTGLVAVNLLVAGLVAVIFGSTTDVGALVLAGANLKSAVAAGEYWRLPASTFLHVGAIHLLINMYGLWILGKLVEQMFGSVRFFAMYMTAGLVGAVASYAFGGPGISAGASGAVFGVLGASVVELAMHRDVYPERWRRALLGNLAVLVLANVAIGFYYAAIDQSAHLGGLVAGAVVTVVLSRETRYASSTAVRGVAMLLTLIGGLSIAYAVFGAASTRYADTVANYEWDWTKRGALKWEQPFPWDEIDFSGVQLSQGTVDEVLEVELRELEKDAQEQSLELIRPHSLAVSLPPGWQSREIVLMADDGMGEQRLRVVFFARQLTRGLVAYGFFHLPDLLADQIDGAVARILGSVTLLQMPDLPPEAPAEPPPEASGATP